MPRHMFADVNHAINGRASVVAAPPAMAGYHVKSAKVYTKQGSALKQEELRPLLCVVCGLILREAMQVTRCGHRFCKSCIDKLLSNSSNEDYRCPVDGERFEVAEVRRDRGCQKEIATLEVDCPTRPNPCPWKGPLVEIEVHRLACPEALVSCSLKCGLDLRREELASHLTRDCSKRKVVCSHCQNRFPSDSIQTHFLECDECRVTCEYCQLTVPSRKLMEKHLQHECLKNEIKCPMNCPNVKGERSSLNKHLNTHLLEMAQHLNTAMARIVSLEATITRIQEDFGKERTEMHKLITKLEEDMKNKEVTRYYDDTEETSTKSTRNEVGKNTVSKSLVPLASSARNGAYNSVTRWEDPGIVGGREGAGMKEEIRSQETRLLKMSETLQTVQYSLTQHSVAIDEVRLRQDVLEVKVTDGVLIWKVPDLRRRYRDALDGRTISLYSPPFYTSPHGYRMCIRTYLNGDGIGKGTHLSVFFILMRSEHDNLLPWPFKQTVRFTLINQNNPSASISEAFVPDVKSPSFHKPENDMNVASGFPKFARQSVLQDEQYTMGNMIFIKCQVDTTGLKLD